MKQSTVDCHLYPFYLVFVFRVTYITRSVIISDTCDQSIYLQLTPHRKEILLVIIVLSGNGVALGMLSQSIVTSIVQSITDQLKLLSVYV